ncbi:hypothetical protein CR513_49580, partial [Mucuna pruriens]
MNLGRHEEYGEKHGKGIDHMEVKALQESMTRKRLKWLGEKVKHTMGLLIGQGGPTQGPTLFTLWDYYKDCNTWRGEMILKATKTEGHAVNIPPLLKYQNYDYWKQRRMAFFVENGNYIPTIKEGVEMPRSLWNEEHKIRYLLNSKARNFLMCALTKSEDEKVHNCKSFKEI